MKANEAPEKIYLQDSMSTDTVGDLWPEWFDAKVSDNSIKYTRTDAFIEKACDAYCKVCGHFPHTVPTHICRHNCEYFSDFKRYIKGE